MLKYAVQFIYLFGVLRCFQHCTGHITTASWKGRGNQYIQFVRVLYCKLLTNGKQLPAFPLETVRGSNRGLRGGRRECYHSATVGPPPPQMSLNFESDVDHCLGTPKIIRIYPFIITCPGGGMHSTSALVFYFFVATNHKISRQSDIFLS